jgi:sugar lactone lactonase YvrE
MLLVDDLALAPDSSIIFTEASRKFPLHTYKLDLLEHRPNGYLFQYDLKTRQTRQLLDSLYFANGVGVSNDGSYALVNDMGRYRVLKYHLTGVKKGQSEVFADNLPGFPDGLNIGSDGTVWLSIVSPRTTSLDFIMRYPFLRKLLLRLPESAQPAPQRYGCILGFDATGKLIHNLQDPKGGYAAITNCVPFQHKLYLGTLTEHSIGVYELR